MPFGGLIALGLFGFALLAMWQLRRLGSLLAQSTREVQRLAYEDPVTGLPNLHRMREVIDQALAKRRPDELVAVALIDLGGFDEMKDAIGDAGEDEVLTEIANRLRRDVPEGVADRAAARRQVRPGDAGDRASRRRSRSCRRRATRSPAPSGSIRWFRSAPMPGWRSAPRDGAVREELMRRADLALRVAKRRGRGLVMQFSDDMEGDFDERRFIKRELSRAMATRSFELHYQPIVRADGGAIVGVESLLRWNHPSRGYIPPACSCGSRRRRG